MFLNEAEPGRIDLTYLSGRYSIDPRLSWAPSTYYFARYTLMPRSSLGVPPKIPFQYDMHGTALLRRCKHAYQHAVRSLYELWVIKDERRLTLLGVFGVGGRLICNGDPSIVSLNENCSISHICAPCWPLILAKPLDEREWYIWCD